MQGWRYGRVGDIVRDMTILVRLAYVALMIAAACGPFLAIGQFTRNVWALAVGGIAGGFVMLVFITNGRLNAFLDAPFKAKPREAPRL